MFYDWQVSLALFQKIHYTAPGLARWLQEKRPQCCVRVYISRTHRFHSFQDFGTNDGRSMKKNTNNVYDDLHRDLNEWPKYNNSIVKNLEEGKGFSIKKYEMRERITVKIIHWSLSLSDGE